MSVSKEKIISVMEEIHSKSLIEVKPYCLAGGALFVLEGFEGYETFDLDVIALEEWAGVKTWEDWGKKAYDEYHPSSEFYLEVLGQKVDWVCEDVKRKEIQDYCLDQSLMHPKYGFYCTPLACAFALKLAVGRPKDIDFCELYRGEVDPNIVQYVLDYFRVNYKYN